MELSRSQSTIYQRIRNSSSSKQAVSLDDDAVRTLIFITARDLDIAQHIKDAPRNIPDFYSPELVNGYKCPGPNPKTLFAQLCGLKEDADTYVSCLATLHKGRLKHQRILQTQPLPTMDQVGMRGLLQYGLVPTESLAALLIWRKWFYDIDNRAAQDTGYLVEPIIAGALGGAPYPANNSPVRRVKDGRKGRQVDCIKDGLAYEFKLRMTIAASGQGRWAEELNFAEDCTASGFTPVLIVLDPTDSKKLTQLKRRFEDVGGRCYIGQEAWGHLYDQARSTMAVFLQKYVERPLMNLFYALPEGIPLPRIEISHKTYGSDHRMRFAIGSTDWEIVRRPDEPGNPGSDRLSEDAGDCPPGFEQM